MKIRLIPFTIISMIFLGACAFVADPVIPTATIYISETPAAVPTPAEGQWTGEAAFINDVAIEFYDPDAGVAEVVIDGDFPDGCTSLLEVVQTQEGNLITIRLITTRPLDAECTMALKPFLTSVLVDLSNIAPGEIASINVYGFEVEQVIGLAEAPREGG